LPARSFNMGASLTSSVARTQLTVTLRQGSRRVDRKVHILETLSRHDRAFWRLRMRPPVLIRHLALLLAVVAFAPARAADMPASAPPSGPPLIRGETSRGLEAWRHRQAYGWLEACPYGLYRPRYGLVVPTNAPCDPTYVGSSMGLSRPSYYGALPGPGYNAP
jgi:hypothetical protein